METLTPPLTTIKTPDPDSDPPPPPPLTTSTNGVLKRHKPLHHHHPPPPVFVAYKECMKNHAAAMGGHAVDGCGEFMPLPPSPSSPPPPPSHPTSLKCSACGCHRNFHRREPDQEPSLFPSPIQQAIEYQPHHRHHPPPPAHQHPPPAAGSPGNSPSPPPISSSYYPSAPHMLLALSSGVSVENNQIINHIPGNLSGSGTGSGSNPGGKKRFRTRFTQEQKEKMHEIAERVGWKMQKRDEELIVGFCNQIGVDKNVFKVWMHNNKTTFGLKKDNFVNFNGNHSSGEGIDFIISRNNNLHDEDIKNNGNNENNGNNGNNQLYVHDNGGFGSGGNVMCTKGSSSSS